MPEAKRVAEERMREIAAMPFDDLLRFVDKPLDLQVKGASGSTYRSKTYSFWDMEPNDSDLLTRVEVTGQGLRRYQRYFGIEAREPGAGSETGDPDVSSTWTETFGCLTLAFFALILLLPWFVGVVYLISRIL